MWGGAGGPRRRPHPACARPLLPVPVTAESDSGEPEPRDPRPVLHTCDLPPVCPHADGAVWASCHLRVAPTWARRRQREDWSPSLLKAILLAEGPPSWLQNQRMSSLSTCFCRWRTLCHSESLLIERAVTGCKEDLEYAGAVLEACGEGGLGLSLT